jgi:hypothetical protein
MKVIAGNVLICQPLHLTVKSSRLCSIANTLHLHIPLLRKDFESIRTSLAVTKPSLHRRQAVMQESDLEEATSVETEAVPLSEFRALLDKSLEVLGYSEDEVGVISDVRLHMPMECGPCSAPHSGLGLKPECFATGAAVGSAARQHPERHQDPKQCTGPN